jgi:hypothetical protein
METNIIEQYGLTVFVLIFLLKELSPVVRSVLEKVLPEKINRNRTASEKLVELQERELDIQERGVIANEQIAKALIICQNNQHHFANDINDVKQGIGVIISNTNVISENVAVLLDRGMRLRADDYKSSIGSQ